MANKEGKKMNELITLDVNLNKKTLEDLEEAVSSANQSSGKHYGGAGLADTYSVDGVQVTVYLSTRDPEEGHRAIYKKIHTSEKKRKECNGYSDETFAIIEKLEKLRIEKEAQQRLVDKMSYKFTQVVAELEDGTPARYYFGSSGGYEEPYDTISHMSGFDRILDMVVAQGRPVKITDIKGGWVKVGHPSDMFPTREREITLFDGSEQFGYFNKELAQNDLKSYFNKKLPDHSFGGC